MRQVSRKRANRAMAEAARRAAEIIQERGKATGRYEDDHGRVCATGALIEAEMGVGSQHLGPMSPTFEALAQRCEVAVEAIGLCSLTEWSDLPTTTAADIAKMFLRVADDLEVAP